MIRFIFKGSRTGLRTVLILLLAGTWTGSCLSAQPHGGKALKLSVEQLKNKIKGGWAGQTIGVTYGWPTEFVFNGTYIQDYQPIPWHDDYITEAMHTFPGLYDDVYMDLTFVDVIEQHGLHAPAERFATAFASGDFDLWHANQAGRYNIRNGIPPGQSGHWLNNPHADDIDFQIEADFAGLMSPGMPAVASEICDRVGHIMNHGDGWYGGVFVANMYAQAFVHDRVDQIVVEALESIPPQSEFYQCISDVIRWHRKYPRDWKQTWFLLQRHWSEDRGCPPGVFHPLNIDAKLNSAYVVLGLLYGEGDFTQTLDIATRAGQDSDCNPSTAAGILGTMLGYDRIPSYWMKALKKAENLNFVPTNYSLTQVYELSYRHALDNIRANHGTVTATEVVIPYRPPAQVPFEENFPGHYPVERKTFQRSGFDTLEFDFTGIGFVLSGYVYKKRAELPNRQFKVALDIDGQEVEQFTMSTEPASRRTEFCWRYQLPATSHQVRVRVLDPSPDYEFVTVDYLVYGDSQGQMSKNKDHNE